MSITILVLFSALFIFLAVAVIRGMRARNRNRYRISDYGDRPGFPPATGPDPRDAPPVKDPDRHAG